MNQAISSLKRPISDKWVKITFVTITVLVGTSLVFDIGGPLELLALALAPGLFVVSAYLLIAKRHWRWIGLVGFMISGLAIAALLLGFLHGVDAVYSGVTSNR